MPIASVGHTNGYNASDFAVVSTKLTGSSDKLNAFILLMKDLGLVEVARTGAVAISRGSLKIN